MTQPHAPQVSPSHYVDGYDHKDRWLSYFYQITAVRGTHASSVLEVGPGNGTVSEYLRQLGMRVITVDIDMHLKPDVVASVIALPFEAGTFDTVMACEVLEHLPFSDFLRALSELARVSKKYVIISLPDARRSLLHLVLKIPFIHEIAIRLRVKKRAPHQFDGEHYWELGKREVSFARLRKLIDDAGLDCEKDFAAHDAPFYHFFVLRKRR
jgi:SAM-dependent methyltransferase